MHRDFVTIACYHICEMATLCPSRLREAGVDAERKAWTNRVKCVGFFYNLIYKLCGNVSLVILVTAISVPYFVYP